ncbi:MAG TPA: NUDIX domain-containing protein [Pyrinomonadaceae bacterium]
MLKDLLSNVWRGSPAAFRHLLLRFTNSRFTVTAGAIIFNSRGQVLLLKHPFRAGSGWGLPGGFMKNGEQPVDALRRELDEEIKLEIHNVELFLARSFERPRQVEILFTAETDALPQPQSIEVDCAVWFDPHELPTGLPKDQKSLVLRAVEKRQV